MRKLLAAAAAFGALGALVFSGCSFPTSDEKAAAVADAQAWAKEVPALSRLEFSYTDTKLPSDYINAQGPLVVQDAAEFVEAVGALHTKLVDLKQYNVASMKAGLTTSLSPTRLEWMSDPLPAAKLQAVPDLVDPAVEELRLGGGARAVLRPGATDAEAEAWLARLDQAARRADGFSPNRVGIFELIGFPGAARYSLAGRELGPQLKRAREAVAAVPTLRVDNISVSKGLVTTVMLSAPTAAAVKDGELEALGELMLAQQDLEDGRVIVRTDAGDEASAAMHGRDHFEPATEFEHRVREALGGDKRLRPEGK